MKRLLPIVILLVALGAGYYWWSTRPSTAAALESNALVGSGTIEAETVDIMSELGGRVLEFKVDEGDEVEAGQVLVELDKAELLAQEVQLEAALTTAKVNLELASAPPRQDEIAAAQAKLTQAEVAHEGAGLIWNQAQNLVNDPQELESRINQGQAQVTEAQQNLEQAQVQLKRMEIQAEAASRNQSNHAGLVQADVAQKELEAAQTGVKMAEVALAGAKQQVEHLIQMRDKPLALIAQADAAKAAYGQTEAAVSAAQANLAAVKAGPASEDIAIAQAQVTEAEAPLATVQVQLAKQTLTAPRAGLISHKAVSPGELAKPGTTLLELSDIETVDLVVYLPETSIGRVKVGQPAQVRVDAYPGDLFEGIVTFINPKAEFTPRNVQTQEERVNLVFGVKISLANPDHRLKPGMPADAIILPQSQTLQNQTPTPIQATSTPTTTLTSTPTPSPTPVAVETPASTSTPPPAETETIQAEIITWGLKVRAEPGIASPVVAYLTQGTVVPVLKNDPKTGWLQVQLPGSQQSGWITNNPAYVSIQ